MNAAIAAKWTCYIIGTMSLGVLIGFPTGAQLEKHETVVAHATATGYPTVNHSDEDYRAVEGSVPDFALWGHGGICSSFEQRYPAEKITRSLQQSFYGRITDAGGHSGEVEPVIDGCAMTALLEANAEESAAAHQAGASHPDPNTILVFGEKAEYFGQDAWCFLCLSTADHHHGTARVVVSSCSPPYGLVHTQVVGTF